MSGITELHSAMLPPQGVWWTDANKHERVWVIIAFIWCMVLFAMMPLWHFKGGQNPSGIRGKTTAAAYSERVNRMVTEFKVAEENGMAVVEPPPGSDVYLLGQMWRWYPTLRLKKGASYVLHLSSLDVNHGFGLHPLNLNFQVVPGYDYGLRITPTQAGDFRVVCNEFCGIGHHNMIGRIVVVE